MPVRKKLLRSKLIANSYWLLAFYIDLFGIIATKYEAVGEARVKPDYFTTKDNTHTNEAGAKINAMSVIEGLKSLKDCALNNYLVNSEPKK